MKKFSLFIMLFPVFFLAGCETISLQNPFEPAQVGYSSEKDVRRPYLVQGATVQGKSEREEMFGTLAEGLTKEELMIQVVDYQEKLKEEKLKREALEKELSLLKKEYGQKIFEMQNQVLKCHKDVEDARAQAEEARIKLLKSEQALDRFKMSALMKKSAVDSQYPVFYEVKKGDSLWRISAQKNIYNDPYKWMEIYTANRDKIDDPEMIYPGQVLRIPRYFEYLFGAPVGEPENIPEPDVQTEEQGEPDDE